MATQYCHNCQRPVVHTENDTSHLLHIILAFITGGLWLPVYFIRFLAHEKKADKCLACGCKN